MIRGDRARTAVRALLACAVVFAHAPASAQDTASVLVPAMLSFEVLDVGSASAGTPAPTRVSFENAVLAPGHSLRISVRAEGDLTLGAESIPASNVSWSTSGVSRGVASNGSLDSPAYTLLFESQPDATSGGVDVHWTLGAPGPLSRAGTYQVSLRWKVESITP